LHAQFTYKIKADSVKVTNDNCSAELIIENSTRSVNGFLYNTGNGRTKFVDISSLFQPLEDQRLSTSNSPSFVNQVLTGARIRFVNGANDIVMDGSDPGTSRSHYIKFRSQTTDKGVGLQTLPGGTGNNVPYEFDFCTVPDGSAALMMLGDGPRQVHTIASLGASGTAWPIAFEVNPTIDPTDHQYDVIRLLTDRSIQFPQLGAGYLVTDATGKVSVNPSGAGGSTLLPNIDALIAYSGSNTTLFIQDSLRGGFFSYTTAVLNADSGVVFPATGKGTGYWIRKYDEAAGVNILWWGAKGDSVTNSTASILSAIRFVSNKGGGAVIIPAGIYLTDGITIEGMSNLSLQATNGAVLKGSSTSVATIIQLTNCHNITIIHIGINGDRGNRNTANPTMGCGVRVFNSTNVKVDGCDIYNCKFYAIQFDSSGSCTAINNSVHECAHGIAWWGGDAAKAAAYSAKSATNLVISNNVVSNMQQGGIWGSCGTMVSVTGNTVSDCGDVGIDFEGTDNFSCASNVVKNAAFGGISFFFRSENGTVSGNTVLQTGNNRRAIWFTIGSDSSLKQNKIIVANNILQVQNGAVVYSDQGAVRDVTINDNNIQSLNGTGIYIIDGRKLFVSKNKIYTNYSSSGISLEGPSNSIIDGNEVYGTNDTISVNGASNGGIRLYERDSVVYNARYNIITNNKITGYRSSITDWAGLTFVSYAYITGNVCDGPIMRVPRSEYRGIIMSNVDASTKKNIYPTPNIDNLMAVENSVVFYKFLNNAPPANRYMFIAKLPASTSATNDYLNIDMVYNDGYEVKFTSKLSLILGNRGGFGYQWQYAGSVSKNINIRAFQQLDGTVDVYLCVTAGSFTYCNIAAGGRNLKDASGGTVLSNSVDLSGRSFSAQAPDGNLVYSSGDITAFPANSMVTVGNLSASRVSTSSIQSASDRVIFLSDAAFSKNGTPAPGKVPVGTDSEGRWSWQSLPGNGASVVNVRAIAASASVNATDGLINLGIGSGVKTLTLPSASANPGRILYLYNGEDGTGSWTITPAASGITNLANLKSYTLISTGSAWLILSTY
jgi:parallel beta-helix repeat protein